MTKVHMHVFILATLALSIVSCSSGQRDSAPASGSAPSNANGNTSNNANGNSPTGASASEAAKPVYVDVRTPEEFAEGHVTGAINIPHDQMAARFGELAAYRDTSLVVYCKSGRRSNIALDVLKRNGFTNIANGGGFEDLRDAGVPSEIGQ